MPEVTVFRVLFDPERTRVDTDHDVMGWGVRFPSGRCYVDWNREAYPEEDRLYHPHVSTYGSMADVRQGTGGTIEILEAVEVSRRLEGD